MLDNIKVFYDGQVFRPELPLDLPPNTHYEISLQSVVVVAELYEFIEPVKIEGFLAENDFLEAFLLSAYSSIQTYFPNAKLKLEIVPAYTGSKDTKLQIGIDWDKNSNELLLAFERLKLNWWVKAIEQTNGCVSIQLKHAEISEEGLFDFFRKFAGTYEHSEELPNNTSGIAYTFPIESEQLVNNANQ